MQFAERDFMENIEKITDIQKKLIILIKKYEDSTRKLLDCDIDDITNLVATRGNVLKRIDELTKAVNFLARDDSRIIPAFTNQCERNSLPSELQEIFDLRQEFNIYAVRAHEMEPEIIERIQMTKEMLMKKIRENNSGSTAKAAKYYNAGLTQGENFYFPKNNKKI